MDKILASVVTVDSTDGIQTLGFSETRTGDGRYVILQKVPDDPAVYLEIDDQINSAYDAINDYKLEVDRLVLQLTVAVGKVTSSAVVIEFPESERATIDSAMTDMFGASDQ